MPSNFALSIHFFLQIAAILAACRIVGWIGRKLGQPQVVGEMITGVLLGPSLLGWLSPELTSSLFPRQVVDGAGDPYMVAGKPLGHPLMTVIYCFAQVGLVLYMFCVGLEFRADLIMRRMRSAASVSLAGILTPFALGAGLAWGFRDREDLFSPELGLPEAMLFMGAAMSITAFPMLARIIYERKLSGTRLGTLALAAGSSDDAIAWCLLAAVLASFAGDASIAALAIGGGVAYAVLTLTLVRMGLKPLGRRVERQGALGPAQFALILVLLMVAAWWTDYCQIYAVFGAFIFGLAVPRGKLSEQLQLRIEPLTTAYLLPFFFVYSGLNTKLTTVNTLELWMIALGVLLAACVGKFVACWAAARLNGEPNREALAIGALMNARGLMELIIPNIGLERGVIGHTLFSIMVLMAVVTTLMATPIFDLIYGKKGYQESPEKGHSLDPGRLPGG